VLPIGTTVSNSRGTFSIDWEPQNAGTYEIWAYFEGTAAFYGSDATTAVKVLDAPTPPASVQNPPYEWYIIGAVIVIVVAIAVHLLITLRKK
jgi:hypothetical protein